MGDEIKRKRGRPKKEGARRNRVQFKMTDDELKMFQYVCASEGNTMTEAIMDAIKTKYNLLKYRD